MLLLQMIKGNLEIWQWLLLSAVLIPSTIKDIRTKKVNTYLCLVAILLAIVFRNTINKEDNQSILISFIPGLVVYVLAVITNEKIGKGDALLIWFIGCTVGINITVSVIVISFILSGVAALFLFAFRRVNRNTEIPLTPFLSIGVLAGGII